MSKKSIGKRKTAKKTSGKKKSLKKSISNKKKKTPKRAIKSRSRRYTGGLLYVQPVNRIDNKGKTQLHHAAEYGNLEVMLAILNDVDVNVNIQDNDGFTPLHSLKYSLMKGNSSIDNPTLIHMVTLLIGKGAQVNFQDNDGFTPLHYAVKRDYNPIDNPTLGNIDIVNILIANGAQVNVQDNDGFTPLHYAAANENKYIMDILLANGAQITKLNRYNETSIGYTSNKDLKYFLMSALTYEEFINYTQGYGQLIIDDSRDVYDQIIAEKFSTKIFGVPTGTPLTEFTSYDT